MASILIGLLLSADLDFSIDLYISDLIWRIDVCSNSSVEALSIERVYQTARFE